jgi:hypothetical protein
MTVASIVKTVSVFENLHPSLKDTVSVNDYTLIKGMLETHGRIVLGRKIGDIIYKTAYYGNTSLVISSATKEGEMEKILSVEPV